MEDDDDFTVVVLLPQPLLLFVNVSIDVVFCCCCSSVVVDVVDLTVLPFSHTCAPPSAAAAVVGKVSCNLSLGFSTVVILLFFFIFFVFNYCKKEFKGVKKGINGTMERKKKMTTTFFVLCTFVSD